MEGNMSEYQQSSVAPLPPPLPEIKITASGYVPSPKPTFEPIRMHFAINNSDVYEAKKQLARGISLEYVTQGCTPLILALLKEQDEIAMLLIRGGADVNHAEHTKQARLPIHVAASYGREVIVRALVEHGASVNSLDNDAMTPLQMAAYEGHLNVVKYLVTVGADVEFKDGRGRTALFNAIGFNHLNVVMYLISCGASTNTVDYIGWSPLIESVVCGYNDLVQALLRNNANVNYADHNGNTPLLHACSRLTNSQQMSLIATNIDYNLRHLHTSTPIAQRAIRHIHSYVFEIVWILLDYGADVNLANIDKDTSLNVAVNTEKYQVIESLISAGADFPCAEKWIPRGIFTKPYLSSISSALQELSVPAVKSLSRLCKYSIRRALRADINEKIRTLPVPEPIKVFLDIPQRPI